MKVQQEGTRERREHEQNAFLMAPRGVASFLENDNASRTCGPQEVWQRYLCGGRLSDANLPCPCAFP
jgi:hypothetical protein